MPRTVEIATHVYVAILTDTGSFHFSSISPRTFEICRLALEAGVDPVQTARTAAMAVDMVDIQPGQGAQQEGA